MSIFTLAIFCLTTSNLPWFINLTFPVSMQYHSLWHQNLLPPPVTSIAQHCFHFGSISSFLLELFLHSSPVAGTYRPGSSSFTVISFFLFILFMGISKQKYWNGVQNEAGQRLAELARLGLLWYWMVCLGNEQRSFCHLVSHQILEHHRKAENQLKSWF